MSALYITICALVILLGFEIRYRMMTEEIVLLKTESARLDKEVARLKEELKKKKNIYEEYTPPSL